MASKVVRKRGERENQTSNSLVGYHMGQNKAPKLVTIIITKLNRLL